MKWQEYQDAVAEFYKRLEKTGEVKNNIYIPDKDTGQPRQIDVQWLVELGDHKISIVIDAKLRKHPLDVKDIEEVYALGKAVKANKTVIVTNSKFTEPAKIKAEKFGLDLAVLTIEEALELIVPDKWLMCTECSNDCVRMDNDGITIFEGLYFFWIAGRCRECRSLYLHCQECGSKRILNDGEKWKCYCNHTWKSKEEELLIRFRGTRSFTSLKSTLSPTANFLNWIFGNGNLELNNENIELLNLGLAGSNSFLMSLDDDDDNLTE